MNPDLVTMDITMSPITRGLDAVKEIKKEFQAAKVIICSAMGQQKMGIEAIEAGAQDFIVKPFDEGRVLDDIKRARN